jgi:tetratricopeptide (TPR) repeat protein
VEIDPYNAFHQGFYGVVLIKARRYDEAIEQFQNALRTSPNLPFAHQQRVTALHLKGMKVEAVAALRDAATALGDGELAQAVARAYAEEGYAAVWRRAADTRASRFGADQSRAHRIATDYLRAGDTDRALDWLEKAYEARDPNLGGISSPDWDGVREHPRFRVIWKRMNGPA